MHAYGSLAFLGINMERVFTRDSFKIAAWSKHTRKTVYILRSDTHLQHSCAAKWFNTVLQHSAADPCHEGGYMLVPRAQRCIA